MGEVLEKLKKKILVEDCQLTNHEVAEACHRLGLSACYVTCSMQVLLIFKKIWSENNAIWLKHEKFNSIRLLTNQTDKLHLLEEK